ncbi:MAG: hypothetical protein QOH25_3585 [Acidobacteriota bacterium]|nr:hypothetical protein [Acidobacteriota bacterium]
MKNKLYGTFAMLSIMVMLAVVSVQAQSRGKLEVNIPFEFQIGSQTLPAGSYSVKRLTQNSILVQGEDGKGSAIAQTTGTIQAKTNETAAREKLVFHKYGSQYFLSQVWMVRGSDGRALNQTDAERQAAKEQNLARSGAKPRNVEVAARVR